MTPTKAAKIAKKIFLSIKQDLRARQNLREEWDSMSEYTRKEIQMDWEARIARLLRKKKAPTPAKE